MTEFVIPIALLILSVVLLAMYIKESLAEKRIYKWKLIFAAALIFLFVMAIIFNDPIHNNEMLSHILDYIYLGCFGLLAIIYYITVSLNIKRKSIHAEFINFIQQERLYVLLDKKDRIREISSSFADALRMSKKELRSKNFFQVFNKEFTIELINDQKLSNEELAQSFLLLREMNSNQRRDIKRELKLYDSKNVPAVLNFIDHPIFINDQYEGHILIGDARTDGQVLHVEEELSSRNEELDLIKERFTAELDLSDEGIFFFNLEEKYYWMNDQLKDLLNLPGNSISADDYYDSIYKDDIAYYTKIIAGLTPTNPEYEITYRFRTGASYVYVREKGKKIFTAETNEIVGFISEVQTNHYERSNILELDNCKSDKEFLVDLHRLYEEQKTIQVVKFKVTNLPQINEQYGRDMGNMVLAEYMKAIWKSFVDEKMIYRVSGLEFYFILTDPRKMSLLRKGLETQSVLHPTMQYGSFKISLLVHMGIASSTRCYNEKAIKDAATKALQFAQLEKVETDYMYYDDIA